MIRPAEALASPSPDDRDARREIDEARRETVYRLLWLASLSLFPNEDQYARIFADEPWRRLGSARPLVVKTCAASRRAA